MMFGSGSGAGPAEHPGGAASCQRRPSTTGACAFLRRPQTNNAFRSHHQFAVLYSDAATTATGPSGRRKPETDRMMTTQVSSSASAAPPPRPSSSFFRSRAWPGAVKASVIGGPSPTPFLLPRHRRPRLRAAIATPPKFRLPGLHLELLRDPPYKTRIHFYLFPILVLAHVSLQAFL